ETPVAGAAPPVHHHRRAARAVHRTASSLAGVDARPTRRRGRDAPSGAGDPDDAARDCCAAAPASVAFGVTPGDNAAMSRFVVSFVCTGNICRSPMGEVILRDLLEREGLADRVAVVSAGTGDWHVGGPADPRAVSTLKQYGLDGERHRAQQFVRESFAQVGL